MLDVVSLITTLNAAVVLEVCANMKENDTLLAPVVVKFGDETTPIPPPRYTSIPEAKSLQQIVYFKYLGFFLHTWYGRLYYFLYWVSNTNTEYRDIFSSAYLS